ncbi:MAG: AhpC/TSA family protein [Bacteroidota bacterium]|nr:AhpC/TSA family protein [Bacteroidota bacterium]
MRLQHLFTGCLLALTIVSCKEKKYGAFAVSGKIEHAPSDKVMLEELPFGAQQPVVLDSTTLKKNGTFELRALAKEEGIYLLAVQNGPEVLLINDSKGVSVHLDINNYKSYTTEGSEASTALHNFLAQYSDYFNSLTETFIKADSLQKVNASDSLVTVTNLQKEEQLKKFNTFLTNTINQSESPALRYYVLGKAFRTMQPEDIQKLANASVEKFKEHSGLIKMKSLIDMQLASDPKLALMNKPAPEISLADTSGKSVSLSSYKGKYVLVDFWASWCKPCRAENPNVVAAYRKFKDKNFTVLGVSLDSDKSAWEQAIQQDSLTWTHVSDLKQWESAVINPYKINAIPFNVLVDPSGKIIGVELRGKELEAKLSEVLK